MSGGCALQTLTPLQMARCVVKAFPWYPDIPAITIWIAAFHGDPQGQHQLRVLLPDEQFLASNNATNRAELTS